MAQSILSIQNLSFTYINQLKRLIYNLSAAFPPGWTAVAGPNGSGKSTLLKLLGRQIVPDSGEIISPGRVLYVDQVCRDIPEGLFDLFARTDSDALNLISLLELQYDWPYRWNTLSQGEKKRCQLGAAVSVRPDALLLDEPVNHLDEQSGKLAVRAMEHYVGCGVLVSHQRELVDKFCTSTLFLPEGRVYPGGYTLAERERQRLRTEERRLFAKAGSERDRLEKEASRRRALAATQQSRRSKKNLDQKDSDGRAKLDLVRISGKDGTDGKLLRQLDGRLSQAAERLEGFELKKEISLGITLSSKISRSDYIWRGEGGFVPYDGVAGRGVRYDLLELRPGDRIVIRGANGTGKTTLLKSVFRNLGDRAWFLEQELEDRTLKAISRSFKNLDSDKRGRVLSTMRRMGADPEDFLSVHAWSPGEMKKLRIAMALDEEIPVKLALLLDEPVNHLDRECRDLLVEALDSYGGAVLMVSHDRSFLSSSIRGEWRILRDEKGAVCTGESPLKN